MTVIFQSGYVPYTPSPGALLKEDGDLLLDENGDSLLLDIREDADFAFTHARIAHSLNWLSGGTATASSTASGFDADAPLNTLTYETWKPSSLAATWAYNHGSSAQCDYACIAAHDLGTSGCTIQIEYYTGVSWIALTPATAISDDSPIFVLFERTLAREWRINITSGTAEPSIGVIKFGLALQMERPIYGGHSPITLARQTILRSNYSETGEYLGRTKQRSYLSTSFAWSNLTAAWVRSNWPTLQKAIEAEPFWIAWRPSSFGEVGFCQVDEVPIPQNSGTRDLMNVSMSVRARGYD